LKKASKYIKEKKTLTQECFLEHPQAQQCSRVFIRNILTISSSLELSSGLESIRRVIPLSTNLPKPLGLKNASKNIIKRKPLLKNVLFNAYKFKKDLGA
jgi:hypothetical protein